MKIIRVIQFTISFVVLLILIPKFSSAWSSQVECPDVSERDHLNVLTINLLFSEIEDREIRLARIVDFIKNQEKNADPVDIILLQEVVGGPLSGTMNSALDLKNLLAIEGMEYNLRYRLANGIPGILTVGNTILSRCKIIFTISKTLPFVTEEPFNGFEIPLRRKVMMSRIKIPGFGKINVYNTHLCAFCDPEERFGQTEVLLDFIETVEKFIWGKNPIILGGDFNTDLEVEVPDELDAYKLITEDCEFIDTYALVGICQIDTTDLAPSCCKDYGHPGCTYAVLPENKYAINPFTGDPGDPMRIDYIFIKGGHIVTKESTVVFNTDSNWVSDHSGVLTKIGLFPPTY